MRQNKTIPIRKLKFLENDEAYFAVFFHQIMSRDRPIITCDSENFIHMLRVRNRSYRYIKWKVQFYNWTLVFTATAYCTENADITHLQIYLHTYFRDNMIITYAQNVPTLYSIADQHFGSEDHSASDLDWLVSRLINAAVLPFRKQSFGMPFLSTAAQHLSVEDNSEQGWKPSSSTNPTTSSENIFCFKSVLYLLTYIGVNQ